MKTQLLYKTYSLLLECQAQVLAIISPGEMSNGNHEVQQPLLSISYNRIQELHKEQILQEHAPVLAVLDQTPFYPEGGGQPADTGWLNEFPVLDVRELDGEIVHVLAEGTQLAPGQLVQCKVNGERRRDNTQQHSGQHLLSANFLRLLGAPTKSFHLGENYATIDIDIPILEKTDADFVERAVNSMIADNYRYNKFITTYEEALKLPLRRKPPVDEKEIRIIEIDGFDYTPCCGTHVSESQEIQLLKIIKFEKYKGMTRVYFVAGLRALAWLTKLFDDAENSARILGCNIEGLGKSVLSLKEKCDTMEKSMVYWKYKSTEQEAAKLAINAHMEHKTQVFFETQEDFEYVTKLAKNLADLGISACIFSNTLLRAAVCIPKTASGNLQDIIKPILVAFELKGGGGRDFFQISFTNEDQYRQFAKELEPLIAI